MRFAVQYFSSSLRLGPEGVAESLGSTAPATVDDGEGAGSVGGT
ncbi:hypothetical protein [Streptomyces sp. NPDC020298]